VTANYAEYIRVCAMITKFKFQFPTLQDSTESIIVSEKLLSKSDRNLSKEEALAIVECYILEEL